MLGAGRDGNWSPAFVMDVLSAPVSAYGLLQMESTLCADRRKQADHRITGISDVAGKSVNNRDASRKPRACWDLPNLPTFFRPSRFASY